MRLLFIFLFPLSLLSQTKIFIEIGQKQSYCGGARPSQEMLDQLAVPKPYANKKFVFVSTTGKTCTATTNSKGVLKIKLKPGSYKGYEAWRYYKKTPDGSDVKNYDMDCLKQTWEKVDIKADVQKKAQHLEINIDDAYCPHTLPCISNPQYPQ